MDFLERVSHFFHEAYCYFVPGAESCSAPAPAPESAAQSEDQFQPLPPLQGQRLEELIRESQPVRVGCYIEMHQVHSGEMLIRRRPELTKEQIQQLDEILRDSLRRQQ